MGTLLRFSKAAVLWTACTVLYLSSANAQTTVVSTGSISAQLRSIATLDSAAGSPVYMTTDGVPGDSRLFVVGQNGEVKIIQNGSLLSAPFLDIRGQNGFLGQTDERGLLGLAFSPNFATDGLFYTFSSENPGASTANAPTFSQPELGAGNGSTQTVIREWTVNSSPPNVVPVGSSSRVLMRIRKPNTNHNGGTLAFGPDGYLYISLGDGGDSNDSGTGHTDSVPQPPGLPTPPGNAQDITNVYGKILRIKPTTTDPTNTTTISSNGQYRTPNSNPFSGSTPGLDEIFAYGLRNPYRMSFDTASGKLYATDTGQGAQEEVDVINNGGNYGWALREGFGATPGIGGPYQTPSGMVDPLGAYTHNSGSAGIGGFIYHGSLLPALEGKYVFGDLTGGAAGELYYMDVNESGPNSPNTVFALNITSGASLLSSLLGFGQDANGEIYAMSSNGQVIELVPEPGTLTLAGFGAIGILWQLRRRARKNGKAA